MRLLDTTDLQLKTFSEYELPSYWILSHKWRDEEVLFDHIQNLEIASSRKGYAKLRDFCDLVNTENLGNKKNGAEDVKYAWLDTCCINKADPTELAEAINSMFRWYNGAAFCVVYLDDVQSVNGLIKDSIWFKRGWTLQELIAPKNIGFYTSDWDLIGLKGEMASQLAQITGIPTNILTGREQPKTCSVAQRMSWAAERETDRPEDKAYSLLGLFDVYLPLLYGSGGEQAFRKLQEEIIKNSNDQSIFAWEKNFPYQDYYHFGLLAQSPSAFLGCHNVHSIPGMTTFEIKQLGMSISLRTLPYINNTYLAVLDCRPDEASQRRIAIFVKRLTHTGQYARVKHDGRVKLLITDSRYNSHECVIRPLLVAPQADKPSLNVENGFHLRKLDLPGFEQMEPKLYSSDTISENSATDYVYFKPGLSTTAGIVTVNTPSDWKADFDQIYDSKWSRIWWMKFGFDAEFNPVCLLGNKSSRFGRTPRLASGPTAFLNCVTSGVDSPERQSLFEDTWMTCKAPGPTMAERWPKGFMILKGNKCRNMRWSIESLNIRISMELLPYPMSSAATLETTSRRSIESRIWTVDITELGCQTPESRCDRYERNKFLLKVIDYASIPAVLTIILIPVWAYMFRKLGRYVDFRDEEDGTNLEDV